MVHMANNAVNKWNFNWAPIEAYVCIPIPTIPTPACASEVSFEGNLQPACVSAVTSNEWRRAPVSKMLEKTCILETMPAPSAILAKSLLKSKLAWETSQVAASTLPTNRPKTPPHPSHDVCGYEKKNARARKTNSAS
jgi:hypothetical protein